MGAALRPALVGIGLDTRDWPVRRGFWHMVDGRGPYGPCPPDWSESQYRNAIRQAYGSLKGVEIHPLN